jgi:hypothetical protein
LFLETTVGRRIETFDRSHPSFVDDVGGELFFERLNLRLEVDILLLNLYIATQVMVLGLKLERPFLLYVYI